jgi:hypothetical protein
MKDARLAAAHETILRLVRAERDALKAEVDWWKDERDALKAEVDWWKDACNKTEDAAEKAEARVTEHHSGGYPSVCELCDESRGRYAKKEAPAPPLNWRDPRKRGFAPPEEEATR